jgi:hypothetical protein
MSCHSSDPVNRYSGKLVLHDEEKWPGCWCVQRKVVFGLCVPGVGRMLMDQG